MSRHKISEARGAGGAPLFVAVVCIPAGPSGRLSPGDCAAIIRKALPEAVLLLPSAADAPAEVPHAAVAAAMPGKPARRRGDWTEGLKVRTANALRAHGLTSREQVAELPGRRLRSIPNIGRESLEDIRRWLRV